MVIFHFLQIVSKVSASENPPFRPEVALKDCPPDILSLMEKCWHEVPEERPTFHTIRGTIRGIMKYDSIILSFKRYNLLDPQTDVKMTSKTDHD